MIRKETSYSDVRKNLKAYLDYATDNHEPIFIKRKDGRNAVIVSEDDYNAMDETDYLLSSSANKKHLLEALEEMKLEGKKAKSFTLEELQKDLED